jgi:RNA polymerase sigma factor (sigma-70 family)
MCEEAVSIIRLPTNGGAQVQQNGASDASKGRNWKGGQVTFEEYAAEQGQGLLRLAFVLTGDAHRAEDLTQGVLTEAYLRWETISGLRHPHAYVRKMVVNAHLDWHRRRSSTEQPIDPGFVAQALHLPMEPDPADVILSRDHLRALVGGLSPRARTVLVLRYYADLDDTATGDAMGLTASSVRSVASRALATLRQSTHEETPWQPPSRMN